jgi:hypothetical protein
LGNLDKKLVKVMQLVSGRVQISGNLEPTHLPTVLCWWDAIWTKYFSAICKSSNNALWLSPWMLAMFYTFYHYQCLFYILIFKYDKFNQPVSYISTKLICFTHSHKHRQYLLPLLIVTLCFSTLTSFLGFLLVCIVFWVIPINDG